jgi:hypothetical protein
MDINTNSNSRGETNFSRWVQQPTGTGYGGNAQLLLCPPSEASREFQQNVMVGG